MSLSYPLEPTLQILAGATGMDRHALVLRQAAIDKKALDKLVKEVAPERAHHYHDWTATASHHWLWLVMVRRAGCNRM
ncbi:MAG TPA: hypothetical protein ENK23_05175 [Sorangium sp.]|nr:hypothetical protein [Sorangium sp.]